MRAILTNFGTTGDIVPLLALALELRRHGHDAVMGLSPSFASRVAQLGLDFCPIGPDLQKAQLGANVALIETPDSVEQIQAQFAPLAAALPQMYDELCDATHDADVLISGPIQPAARMVHETTCVPFVSIQLAHFGGVGPPAVQQASAALINPFRERLGLPPLRYPLTIDANSPQLALYAMSRHVRPQQADHPSHHHLVGFFFLDEQEVRPDPRLVEFLAGGTPPVVITFGNMPREDTRALTELVLEAIGRVGCRAIIPQAWAEATARPLPPGIYAVGYVSHGWLFPQCACIVHHGGGTSGAVFRSGVPSVFVPHGHVFDQLYWAKLAQELGCAEPPIPHSQLSADKLAAAITATLNTPRYYQRAAALGEKIRAEQGVKRARVLIEKLVLEIGLSQPALEAGGEPDVHGEREEKSARRRRFQEMRRSRKKEADGSDGRSQTRLESGGARSAR